MIFDNIDNIELYKTLSADIDEGLTFLRKATPDVTNGVHQLNPRVKAIVSEYETKVENENGFEAHKRYIDIQALLQGEERIACFPIEKLVETKPYSEEIDAAFYVAAPGIQPSYLSLQPGYFAIFHPQDGHMPQLSITAPQKVKKVVVKIEIPN